MPPQFSNFLHQLPYKLLDTQCLFLFLSLTPFINIYFLWNGLLFTKSSRHIFVFIRLDGSSVPLDTETSSPLHSSFGTCDLPFSRYTHRRLLLSSLHRLLSPGPALKYRCPLEDRLYSCYRTTSLRTLPKWAHQWRRTSCPCVLVTPKYSFPAHLPSWLDFFLHPISFQNVTHRHVEVRNGSVHC